MWIQDDSTEMGMSSTKIDKRMYTRRKRIESDRWLFHPKKQRILGIQSENMFFQVHPGKLWDNPRMVGI